MHKIKKVRDVTFFQPVYEDSFFRRLGESLGQDWLIPPNKRSGARFIIKSYKITSQHLIYVIVHDIFVLTPFLFLEIVECFILFYFPLQKSGHANGPYILIKMFQVRHIFCFVYVTYQYLYKHAAERVSGMRTLMLKHIPIALQKSYSMALAIYNS